MTPKRQYRTESGTFEASELAILVWMNPDRDNKPQSRLLMTLTDRLSPHPMAFPLKTLQNTPEFASCPLATPETLADLLVASTPTTPIIILLPIAQDQLGWTDFYIPTKYTDVPK
jgi:hypothetical protein